MSEQKVLGNPFEEENFVGGGGGWDGRIVTVTAAVAKLHTLQNAVDKDGKPIIKNVLEITGITDDQDAEWHEQWGAGGLVPLADGSGFVNTDGSPGSFHKNCEMAKVNKYLKAAGFDMGRLWDAEKQRQNVNGLVGARFLMKGEVVVDKEGKVKKNKKGYEVQRFYPVKFEGFAANTPGGAGGGGSTPPEELTTKAVENVRAVLTENGGKATRAELIRKLAEKLAKDPDGNKVVALVAKADFHKDKPWTVDGTGYTL